jgi:NADPH-dependent 2,4-dienoyl-CoA reductase/sulfur reductase-like enzyme
MRRSPEAFREKLNIEVKTGHDVSEIDLQSRRVRIQPINGGGETLEPFDRLVIATGSAPIRPPVPGIDIEGVYGANSLDDGSRLMEAIEQKDAKKAVIVGGGYIGIEMAEALVTRGLKVAVVDMLPQVMGTLDADMAALVAEALDEAGVDLYLGEKLEGFDGAAGGLAAVKTDKQVLAADLAVLGLGVRPNTAIAEEAGIHLGVRKAIEVDDHQRAGEDNVWAAGDCAQSLHLVSRKPAWVALGSVANKQGRVAGVNIGGGDAAFPGVVGTAITRFMDTEIARTGLSEREAADLGLEYVSRTISDHIRAGYYPDPGRITVKLVAEKGTGRLLGAQIVGTMGAARRIDVTAVALHAGLSVEDMINLDLGYSPPFSTAWDPIHIAARQTLKLV